MNLARPLIKNLKAYSPPLAGRTTFDGLLLDFNERSDSPQVKGKNRYPEYDELQTKLAAYCGVGEDQILLTNGSDQAIDVVFRTFVDAGDRVVIPSPTFGMIEQVALLAGADITAPLFIQPNLDFPINEVLASSAKLIVICNPNSPTGTLLLVDDIAKIAAARPNAVLMIDEAYFEFSSVTAVGLIKQYPNIVVTRTFSKAFGLAGLRLGYVVASPTHIAEMRKVCGPYTVSAPAQTAGLRALGDIPTTKRYIAEVMKQAKPLVENFFEQNGTTYYKSAANFVLCQPKDWRAVLAGLEQRGILVRPQDRLGTPGCLRVTIGSVAEIQRFIAAYQKILKEQS